MTTKGKTRFWAKLLSALLIMGMLLSTAGTAALADAGEPTETVKAAEIAEPEAKEPKQTAEPSEEAEVEEAQEPPGEAEVEEAQEPSGEAGVEEAQEPSEEAETEAATEPPAGTKAEETQEPVEGAVTEEATESTEAETIAEPTEDSVPKEVRAFLEAAAALPSPSQITAENAEKIGGQVNAVLDLWDVLGEEFSQRSDVTEALESVYAVYEAVLGVEESFVEEEPALYATNGNKIPVGVGTTDPNVTKTAFITYDEWKKGGVSALGVSGNYADENRYGTVVVEPDGNTETVDCGNMTFYTYYGIAVSTNWKENGGLPWLMQCPNWLDCWFTADGGVLSIHFKAKPGAKAGQSGQVKVNYAASWVVVTNNGFEGEDNGKAIGDIYYNVTVGGEGSSVPEKPDAPDKSNVTLPYVFVQCQDSTWDKTNHSAPAKLFYDGETTIEPGEVIENTSAVSAFKKSDYPYQCTVKLKGDYYVNLWNRSLAGRLGTHYLHSEPKDITFYYSAAEGKWKCPTSSLIYFNSPETGSTYGWLVKITKKKPVEPDPVYYSVCYTDGVKGEIVFSDQVKMGLEVNAETPKFVMQADTVKENGDGTTTTIVHTEKLSDGTVIPHREGYTFKGWSLTSVTPNRDGVQKKVAAGDANGNKEIIYTARWEKNPTVEIGDLTATKTSSKSAVIVGEEFKYTIKVENDSDSSAVVKITDVLDKRLDFSRVSESDGGVYDEKTHTVTWENITVPANGSKNVLVWVRANTAGSIDNMATVTLEDQSIDTNEVTVTVTKPEPEPAPELKVTKTVDLASVEVGKSVTYTITVTNTGNADASNVTVTDTLDKKLDFKSADNGGSYVSDTRTVTWKIAEVKAGEAKELKLEATANASGQVQNTAHAQIGEDTPVPSNPVDLNVKSYKIKVTKSLADPSTTEFDTGASVRYKVVVSNTGTDTLYNTYITDTMDPGLTMETPIDPDGINSGAADARCVYAGQIGTTVRGGLECKVYRWNLNGEFKPGESVTLYYTAVIGSTEGEEPQLRNVAYARGHKTPQRQLSRMIALFSDYVDGSSDQNGNDNYVEDNDDSGVVIKIKTYSVIYSWNLPAEASEILPTEPKHAKNALVTVDTEYPEGKAITVGTGEEAKTYVFSGWTVPEDLTVEDGKFTMPARDVIIIGTWTEKVKPVVKKYTVTYTDGVDGEEVFVDQIYRDVEAGSATPEFKGTPNRVGYEFIGWSPEVAEEVTGDAIYVAQWKKLPEPTDPTDPDSTESTEPTDPTDPTDPTESTEPTDPIDPTDSTDPTDPTDSTESTEPTDPTEPTGPENPTESTEPENPVNPTEPVEPENPVNPTEPVEPENPTTPTEPEPPATPVTPENPTTPVPPENPTVPVVPTTPVTPALALTPLPPATPTPAAVPEGQTAEIPESEVPLSPAVPQNETEPETEPETEALVQEIEEEAVPLASGPSGDGKAWALINFALMNLAVFESLMLLIGYFVRTKKSSEEKERMKQEDREQKLKKRGIMRIISLPVAIISVIAFCLTEDISLPTAFVDRYTILMAVIAIVQTVVVALSRKKEEKEEVKAEA